MLINLQTSAIVVLAGSVAAIDLNINDELRLHSIELFPASDPQTESVKNAATAAFNTMSNYTSNTTGHIPGKLDRTWWMVPYSGQ